MKKIIALTLLLTGAISLKAYPITDKKYFFVNQTRENIKVCCFFGRTSDINPVCRDILPHYTTFFADPNCLKYFILYEANYPYYSPLDDFTDVCTDKTFYIRYYDEPNRKITVEVEATPEENYSARGEGA